MAGISKTWLATFGIIIIVLAVVAGYGWMRPPEKVTETTEKSLVDLAKDEGKLVIYGVVDTPDFVDIMLPMFLDIYPWADVEYVGMSPGDILTKALSEYQLGTVMGDIALNSMGSNIELIKNGAGESYANPMEDLMAYPEGMKDPQALHQLTYGFMSVMVYNTELVSPADVPTSWTDLGDPKWKDKIAIDDPSLVNIATPVFVHVWGGLDMTDSEWVSLMEAIAANNPRMCASASEAFSFVAAGEAHLCIAGPHDVKAGQDAGMPVETVVTEFASVRHVPALILTDCPHPNMAKLFCQWLASTSGQYAFAATGRMPLHPAIVLETGIAELPGGMEPVMFLHEEYWSDPSAFYDAHLREIFG